MELQKLTLSEGYVRYAEKPVDQLDSTQVIEVLTPLWL